MLAALCHKRALAALPALAIAVADLARVRRKAGLRHQALAKKLDKAQSFVAKYEGGEIEFIAIARALDGDPHQVAQEILVGWPTKSRMEDSTRRKLPSVLPDKTARPCLSTNRFDARRWAEAIGFDLSLRHPAVVAGIMARQTLDISKPCLRKEQQSCCRKDWHSAANGAPLNRPGATDGALIAGPLLVQRQAAPRYRRSRPFLNLKLRIIIFPLVGKRPRRSNHRARSRRATARAS